MSPTFSFQSFALAAIAKLRYVNIGTTLKANMAFSGAHVFFFISVAVQCKCRVYGISMKAFNNPKALLKTSKNIVHHKLKTSLQIRQCPHK